MLLDCSNCHLKCDDDISVMLGIFPIQNSPFIDIHVVNVGSSSCIDEETPATVTNVAENIPQHVADYCVSSDDSNYEDNMINGNFVSNRSTQKYV